MSKGAGCTTDSAGTRHASPSRMRDPSTHEHLTPVDTAWLRMEERGNPVDIAALMLFEGELSEERLRELIATRILAHHPRFRRRVVESPLRVAPPHWEDEPGFSLDHHVERLDLPAPSGTAELEGLIGTLLSRPMDLTRSPWHLYLVDGLPGGTALISRIHHCMGDGFALMQLLLSLADADEGAPEAEMPRKGEPEPTAGAPARLANFARLARDDVQALGHLLLLSFEPESHIRGRLGGERRVAWSRAVPLSRVKAIGRARGATVNDVLMTAVSGALRRYLAARGDAVDDLTLRAIVPVNLRPPEEAIDLEHGNWFGLIFVDLPVCCALPGERASRLKATLDRIKASQEAIVSLGVLAALGRAPEAVEHVLDGLFARKGSLVVTNVPGPRTRLRLAGAPMKDMMFWAPHSGGLALGVSILSYAGHLRVGVRSDAAVIPDPQTLAAHFEEELDVLESLPG
jgi:diacylglycerol O-acyltransferase / wax synthase